MYPGDRWIHGSVGASLPSQIPTTDCFRFLSTPVPVTARVAGKPFLRRAGSPMATKLSADNFITCVRNSGLIPEDQLERMVSEIGAVDADSFADELVRRGALTRWQCEKLLQGRHKGFTLGKYRLLSLLGKGGMSAVYLAEHKLMRRRCAIKVLPAKRVNDSSYLGRFHREAQAVASLDHPNIVRAYDVDHEKDGEHDIHFLVMEYVEGRSLHEVVQQDGVIEFALAAEYVRQAAEGLAYAHQAGLVHRDIKPGNLLLDLNGTVKILDLGLALVSGDEEFSLTVAHDEKVLGTADYLAPEQALDSHKVDARADIYSLGCTLYFLLTGYPPFTEGTLAQRLMAHQTKAPPPLVERRADTPNGLAAIVVKMMAKRPEDRYQTAKEVAEVLAAWVTANGSSAVASASSGAASQRHTGAGSPRAGQPGSARLASLGTKAPSSLKGKPGTGGAGSESAPRERRPAPATIKSTGPQSDLPLAKRRQPVAPPMQFPVGPPDSEFHSFEVLNTAPPMTSGPRSAMTQRKPKQSVSPVVWLAAAGGLLVVVLFIVVLLITRGGESSPTSGGPAPNQDSQSNEQGNGATAEAPNVSLDLIGKEIIVGADGDFASITAALEYLRKNYPVGRDEEQVLKVRGGTTYREAVEIDNRDFSFPKKIRLISEGPQPAILSPEGTGPVVRLVSLDQFHFEGFQIDGAGRESIIELGGYLSGTTLRGLKIEGVTGTGILGRGPSGGVGKNRLRLEDVSIIGDGANAVGIRFEPGDATTTSHVTLAKLRLIGPMAAGLQIDDAVNDVDIAESVFALMETGVKIAKELRLRDLVIRNNTFFKSKRGIVVEQLPVSGSDGLAIRRNLFAGNVEADVMVVEGFDAEAFSRLLTTSGNPLDSNLTTRQDSSTDEIGLFKVNEQKGIDPEFISQDPSDGGFLAPSASSAVAKVAAQRGEPAYVGGVPPQ